MCCIFLLCVNYVTTVCRSDPTENDSVEGLRPNARGPGLVTFGVSVLLCMQSLQENLYMFFGLICLLHKWKTWCLNLYWTFFHCGFAARPGHGFLQE